MQTIDEKEVEDKLKEQFEAAGKNLDSKINIVIVGRVSTGKSSLLNAFFKRKKGDELASVGAISGVTKTTKAFQLSKNVTVIDSPGLGDINSDNSEVTKQAISNGFDVGILVVSGSADSSQKQHYEELKAGCKKVFVVLNKIDEYDKKKAALESVCQQWHEVLGLKDDEQIFKTCTDGYDPQSDADAQLNIRGVDELRKEVLDFLERCGKDLLVRKLIEKNSTMAKRVIYTCMIAVAGFAFLPGSAIPITAAQGTAIMTIHYIYTNEIISKNHVLAAIPLFASQSVGSSAFLFVKSFLPPTGVVDVVAAGIAVSVTLAMLSTVNWMYENGYNSDNKQEVKEQYKKFYQLLKDIGLKDIFNIVKSGDKTAIMALIGKFVKD